MQARGLYFLALLPLFLPTFSFSYDLTELSDTRAWHQLLHFRDGESEIDSSNFFLSPKGKTDASAELNATIQALTHDENNVTCRFPARVQWLYATLPELEGKVPYRACADLERIIGEYQASKAVLVFPTAHINSPASMFGHTFLRLDDKKGLPLTANAINYAAKGEDRFTNGWAFAYKGLFGGYPGRYSVLPYYKKIKEYNNLERRDMWEYTLDLSEKELERMLTHLYELKDTTADYFFTSENCSYNLLWLLEAARPNLRLVEQFRYKVIPVDTIRALKDAGLIASTDFRPSKTKRIRAVLKARDSADGTLKEACQAEIDTEILQLKRTKNEIEQKPYIQSLMQLLAKRSKLPKLPPLDIPRPSDPMTSHKTARVSLAVDSDKGVTLGAKIAFHDIYDVDSGFTQGAYIDFLHVQLRKERDEDVVIEKLDIVNINSYAARDAIFKPLSWGVAGGMKQFRGESYLSLRGEVGVSYALGEDAFVFGMLTPKFYYHDEALFGAGTKLGMMASFSSMKFGLLGDYTLYTDGEDGIEAEVFGSYMLSQEWAFNTKYTYEKNEDEADENRFSLSLFYYF